MSLYICPFVGHMCFLNFAVYASVLYIRWGTNIFKSCAVLAGILYGETLVLGLVISLIKPSQDDESDHSKPLFRERMYDSNHIRQYLSEADQIGVNMPWGEGKYFLIWALAYDKEVSKDYVFIQLRLDDESDPDKIKKTSSVNRRIIDEVFCERPSFKYG